MPRQSLSDLLGNVEEKIHARPSAPDISPAHISAEDEPVAVTSPITTARPTPVQPVDTDLPTYLTLIRKETRLREDQQNQLTLHARRLNRAKTTGAPRITDNTLIRVAVDLLLARIDIASGDHEAALLESLKR